LFFADVSFCFCFSVSLTVRNPFAEFLAFLPEDRKPVDAETASIIERFHGDWLRGIFSQDGAISLLEAAANHVHQSTSFRIRSNAGLLLDGCFQQGDSDHAELVKAFTVRALAPKIIKFGSETITDYQIFALLELSAADAIANHLVPLEFISDINGKCGVVMPAFLSSLSSVKSNINTEADAEILEGGILKCVHQVLIALRVLHRHGISHNDIKPGNILLDINGDSFLCDYGSCTCPGIREPRQVKFSDAYKPSDFNRQTHVRRNTPEFDELLLAVTALDRLELLQISCGFTISQLKESATKVVGMELKTLLHELIKV
jgi:serine/threonine protein kinase